jgi:hypothetical protein
MEYTFRGRREQIAPSERSWPGTGRALRPGAQLCHSVGPATFPSSLWTKATAFPRGSSGRQRTEPLLRPSGNLLPSDVGRVRFLAQPPDRQKSMAALFDPRGAPQRAANEIRGSLRHFLGHATCPTGNFPFAPEPTCGTLILPGDEIRLHAV